MPVVYKIDKERQLVLSTGSGRVTKEEVFTYQDHILKDPDFDPSFSELADFAQLTDTDIGIGDLRTIAQRDVFSIHSRRAFIVKGDVAFGFAKIFEVYRQLAGAGGIRVFRTLDEAWDWIVTPDAVTTFRTPETGAGTLGARQSKDATPSCAESLKKYQPPIKPSAAEAAREAKAKARAARVSKAA